MNENEVTQKSEEIPGRLSCWNTLYQGPRCLSTDQPFYEEVDRDNHPLYHHYSYGNQ